MTDRFMTLSSIALGLICFGFAPGACIRILVLAYPRFHPRRRELVSEVYTVPRLERPFWVFEQIEVALSDALPIRMANLTVRRKSRKLRRRDFAQLVDSILEEASIAGQSFDRKTFRRAFHFICGRTLHLDPRRADQLVAEGIAVARIHAMTTLDTNSLCVALLRGVTRSNAAPITEIAEEFGPEIAELAARDAAVAVLPGWSQRPEELESYMRLLVASANDRRVVLLKISEMLAHLQNVEANPPNESLQIASESLHVYAPLARRLELSDLAEELEDLAFRTLRPRAHDAISRLVMQTSHDRLVRTQVAADELAGEVTRAGLAIRVTASVRSLYSIYVTMVEDEREFNTIFDLNKLDVTVDSARDCYATIGVIHSLWKPLPGIFKDYIAMPEDNMYQALHTTVIGPRGAPFEIRVWTAEMKSHARRLETGIRTIADRVDARVSREPGELRPPLGFDEISDSHWALWEEFLSGKRANPFADEVYVFSPDRKVVALPVGAVPLDFAYAIHSDLGNKFRGATVNGRTVSLDHVLRTGDVVEVRASRQSQVREDMWLGAVVTARAQREIRRAARRT